MQDAHVEPVQSLRSRRGGGRRRTLLAVATPVVVLVAVVAGGVLGQAPTPEMPGPTAALSDVDEAPPKDEAVGPGFPVDAFGLPVWSVRETLDQIRGGRMSRGVVAVAGWLTVRPPGGGCDHAGYAYCRQETVLAASGAPAGQDQREVLRLPRATSALRAIALPGAALRVLGSQAAPDQARKIQPVPAVLIGSVSDDHLPECRSSGRRCEDAVALERVVWADNDWIARHAVMTTDGVQDAEAGSRIRHEWIRDVVPGVGETLSEVLVPIGRLHSLDPQVDAAVPGSVVGPVWYVRFLVHGFRPRAGEPHDVGWAVIHDASGTVVAAYPGWTAGDVTRLPGEQREYWPVM